MFDVGFTELVMIGLVALLVVGPERLPELVRTVGRWIGRAQRVARDIRSEFEREIGTPEITQLQREINQTSLDHTLNDTISPDDRSSAPQSPDRN